MPKKPFFQGRHISRRSNGDDTSIEYCESSYSLSKQAFLQEYIRNHGTAMATGETYTFVDCHGGLGNWRDRVTNQYCNGSPVIFYRTLQAMGLPYRGLVFELEEDRCAQLQSNLYYEQENISVYNEDNCNAPDRLREIMHEQQRDRFGDSVITLSDPYMYGTIYYDYTGWPKVSEISCAAESSSLDLLVHFSTSWWKALSEEKRRARLDNQLFQNLDELNRRYWYVSDPTRGTNNKFNFTFLHGSNIHNQSIHSHLVPIDSDEGQRRLIVAQYSKRRQQELIEENQNV